MCVCERAERERKKERESTFHAPGNRETEMAIMKLHRLLIVILFVIYVIFTIITSDKVSESINFPLFLSTLQIHIWQRFAVHLIGRI